MEKPLITMTHEEWEKKYKPVRDKNGNVAEFNTDSCSDSYEDMQGKAWELSQQKRADNFHIWTVMDVGEKFMVTYNGEGFVDAMAYMVTEIPWEGDVIIQVDDNTEED